MSLLRKYKKHFGMLFSTFAANMILIACYLRLMQTTIAALYYQDWFRIYPDDFQEFSNLSSIGTLVGGPLATLLTGVFVDMFQSRSEMTIPMICIIKSLMEVPFMWMIFGQVTQFYVAIGGIYCEYFLAKGWTSSAMLILSRVVDPEISYLGINSFIVLSTINYSVTP
jgi:hypothetical protein